MNGPADNGSVPLLSVIIVAHDRTQYLWEAVQSVVNQDLQRSRFEVAVVKNFADRRLDAHLSEVDAASILCTEQPGPRKVAVAFRRCRGQIILILDDDDLFEPTRLRTVLTAFESHPNLGFYGNQASYIGPGGNPLDPRSIPRIGNRPRSPRGRLLLEPPRSDRALRRLTYRYPDFNIGSSAVRRELIERALPYLLRLQMTADSLLFFSALASDYAILLDDSRLTRYRIHGENSSLAGSGTPSTKRGRLLEFVRVAEQDYQVIRELVALYGDAPALHLIDARLAVAHLSRILREPRSRRWEIGGLLVNSARYYNTYPVRESLPTLLAAALCLLSPSMGREAFFRQMQAG